MCIRDSLLTYQKKFKASLAIYDSLLLQLDTTQLDEQQSILEKANPLAHKMGNSHKAYHYSSQQNLINEKISQQKKEQETAYLKIKFESEQKEKENQQLCH